jgi:hypothetical protein
MTPWYVRLAALALVLAVLLPQADTLSVLAAQPTDHATLTQGGEMWSWSGCDTVNCRPRRESGVGRWTRYHSGEAVVGVIIDRDHDSRMMFCHWRVADDSGWVLDGVVNYWPGEERYGAC